MLSKWLIGLFGGWCIAVGAFAAFEGSRLGVVLLVVMASLYLVSTVVFMALAEDALKHCRESLDGWKKSNALLQRIVNAGRN